MTSRVQNHQNITPWQPRKQEANSSFVAYRNSNFGKAIKHSLNLEQNPKLSFKLCCASPGSRDFGTECGVGLWFRDITV